MGHFSIKKIDKLLLRSFSTTFILLLALVLFILVVHTFFLVFHSVAGKGLGVAVYAKLLFYIGLSVFPSAFPIAVLVTSLIVFGHLAESYELTAMRSVGLSLQRTLRFPFIFVLTVSGLLFYFQNYIHPTTKHRIFSLVTDITAKKTALLIQPGVICNDIPGYSIHIDKKRRDDNTIEGITIYDYTQTYGKVALTIAEKGKLYTTPDKNHLVIELTNGHNYVEPLPTNSSSKPRNTAYGFYRNNFVHQKIKLSLEAFKLGNTNEQYEYDVKTRTRPQLRTLLQDTQQRVTTLEHKGRALLNEQCIDGYSIPKQRQLAPEPLAETPPTSLSIAEFLSFRAQLLKQQSTPESISIAEANRIKQILYGALHAIDQKSVMLKTQKKAIEDYTAYFHEVLYEKHYRVAVSVRCIIMFLLASPLGCLIRRGGFGIAVLISSFFILLEYMLSIFGRDLVDSNLLSVFVGAWLPNFALMPFCLFFLLHAQQGISIQGSIWLQHLRNCFKRKKIDRPHNILLD